MWLLSADDETATCLVTAEDAMHQPRVIINRIPVKLSACTVHTVFIHAKVLSLNPRLFITTQTQPRLRKLLYINTSQRR